MARIPPGRRACDGSPHTKVLLSLRPPYPYACNAGLHRAAPHPPRHPSCPCRKPATWEPQVPVCLGFFRFRRSVRNSRHPQPLGTVRRGSRQPPAPHFPVRKPRVVYRSFCFDGATQPAHSRQHRQAAPAGQTLSRPTAPLAVGRILWVICGHITYKQVGLDGSGGITIRRPFSWVR